MCAVSMIMDHYYDKWQQPTLPQYPPPFQPYIPKIPTQQEIDEFYKLLNRAREYDTVNNQPDCELDEKKQKLLKLAEELGIKITIG